MKKILFAVLFAVLFGFCICVADAATIYFDDGYGNTITSEYTDLTEYQIKEIKDYGVQIYDDENTYFVHHKDHNLNEEYNYIVVLTDNELEAIK